MTAHYTLKDRNVVPATLEEWAAWFESADRQVAKTQVRDAEVSTVFLGLDHKLAESGGPPLIFETLVFGGKLDGEMDRYSTWEQAVIGHDCMCGRINAQGLSA